jgi:hypothetical protein
MDADDVNRVGLVRAAIVEEDLPWRVTARLSDDEALPSHGVGGSLEGVPRAEEVARVDFREVLVDRIDNPMLVRRRTELGLAPADTWALVTGSIQEAAAPPAGGAVAARVDWRSRWGWPWITTIRDQANCQACWAFAGTALVEAMTRIEHAVWTLRSEGDVHKGVGKKCANTGSLGQTVDFIQKNGLCDPDCFPWTTADIPYAPSPDRKGRTVKIDTTKWIGSVADQKKWIDAVGPVATWFLVHDDFFSYGSGVYVKSANAKGVGGHFMLVVGYDDAQSCWIVKNSWDSGWGENGYCRIKYGESGIDKYAKLGLIGTDPDPLTRRRLHNGCFFESGIGTLHRNFQLLAKKGTGLHEWWREGTHPFPWKSAATFGSDAASFPTFTSTTFDRNYEAVCVTTTGRLHHWWFGRSDNKWHDGGVFGPTDAVGTPGFVQGNYGKPGNFEVVVGTASGQFNHWWRDHGGVWHDGGRYGTGISQVGPALVQGRDGKNGSLGLVCVLTDSRMQHWWRNDDEQFSWSVRDTFSEDGYTTAPCMIEGQFGAQDETRMGNYELCVVRGNKIEHWWRWNTGDEKWRCTVTFGSDAERVVGLVEGSWGFNLELVVLRTDGRLQHYWRDRIGWHAGETFG